MSLNTVHEIEEMMDDIKQDAQRMIKCLENNGDVSVRELNLKIQWTSILKLFVDFLTGS